MAHCSSVAASQQGTYLLSERTRELVLANSPVVRAMTPRAEPPDVTSVLAAICCLALSAALCSASSSLNAVVWLMRTLVGTDAVGRGGSMAAAVVEWLSGSNMQRNEHEKAKI